MKTKMKMTTHSQFVLIKFHMCMPCKMADIRTAFFPSEATKYGPLTWICPKTLFFHKQKKRKVKLSSKMLHCPLLATFSDLL
jgi:hypothetical protein